MDHFECNFGTRDIGTVYFDLKPLQAMFHLGHDRVVDDAGFVLGRISTDAIVSSPKLNIYFN